MNEARHFALIVLLTAVVGLVAVLSNRLTERLKVPVTQERSKGPGITEVSMETADGPISISRADGKVATFSSPGSPDRPVALKRRDLPDLLAEELRRLDEDDTYAATVRRLVKMRRKR